jgi:hypothetical protein
VIHVTRYEIHPTQEHMVMTPDGGVIECKHEAAAKRVRDDMNRWRDEEGRLWAENGRLFQKIDTLRTRLVSAGLSPEV